MVQQTSQVGYLGSSSPSPTRSNQLVELPGSINGISANNLAACNMITRHGSRAIMNMCTLPGPAATQLSAGAPVRQGDGTLCNSANETFPPATPQGPAFKVPNLAQPPHCVS